MKSSTCMKASSDPDVRKAILAENVEVCQTEIGGKQFPGLRDIKFDFLCGNCGHRHWAEEIACQSDFSVVGWSLACGRVMVRMPWAQTAPRDAKSVYGK